MLDPACGTGHFLVAAARRLGPSARCTARTSTPRRSGSPGCGSGPRTRRVPVEEIEARVRVADGLTAWDGQQFDAVIGNPPFLGQLKRRTAGQRGGLAAYTDTSEAFLHRALDLVVPEGTVALVQPLSVLGSPRRRSGARRGRPRSVR